ncbi:hypothetical protein WJX82_004023 [Trebouxia sp. C0006]
MADVGNHRWVENFAQHQGSISQRDVIWLTGKLTLPTDMHAKWRNDEHTAFSAGHACLDMTLPDEMQLDGLQLQGLISSCLERDKSDLYVPVLTMSLSGCKVDHAVIWRLAAEIMRLGSHCMLRNLDLSSCSLPSDALGWLAYLRPATEQLQRLDIDNNPLLRLNSCKQLLETSMLFEDAPLRLLSIHHTGMTNEDLCLLFDQLTADPEEISTQAYLTCLKLGPAVHWTSASDQPASQTVPFTPETLQRMVDMLKGLSELEVLQVWGLDAEQQARLADAWSSVKAHPGHVTTTTDSFRICTSPCDAEHAVEHWPKDYKLPTQPPPAPTPSPLPSPERDEQPMSRGSGDGAAGGHQSLPSPSVAAPGPDPHDLEADDDFQLLPPRHIPQHHALPIQRSRPQSVAAGSARVAQYATARPRHRSGHTHRHRQSWKPPHDTGETAVSRLYANLGLGYDAPNSVDDAEFADNPRQGRPVGHARLQPSAHAAGDNLRQHRHPGRRQQSNGPRQRARAVAPEYGGGREYDIEAEFMNELGPLPKARPDDGDGGAVRRPKQRRQAAPRGGHSADDAAAMDFDAYEDAVNQPMDWQAEPDMLDSHRAHSISPRGERNDWTHGMSPSPIRHNSSPGTDLESDGPTHQSPQVPADQPAGVDSDDNFEVSDDADERQLRRGRWDEEDDVRRGGDSSGSEAAAAAPAVRPVNMTKREWELLQEARELEQGAFAFDKNRSKYQPKGHFDAAVGGRRRHQKAAAGTAFEKLRQRRLQQAALTGAGAVASDADVPVSVSAEAKRSETADLRVSNRSGNWQRRFVDDQAAGGDSSRKLPEAERRSRIKHVREHGQVVPQGTNTQSDMPTPNAAMASLPPPHSRAPRASSLGRSSSPREEEAAEAEDGEDGSNGAPEEEEAAAFEVPSQMPRELQSWAWDKQAGQHPPNLQKIYPAQAKRVRRAPDRYSAEEAPLPPLVHRSASEEQRRLADQLHRSHPPCTHSGKKRKSRQSTPGALVTPVQAAQEASSDDEDDDTPLAMLPASAPAPNRATASSSKTPKAETAPKLTTAESAVPLPTSSSHCKRKRQSKQQHDIQLPAVFTMQGVSANTACFHSLSFKAGSTRIHGLVPASQSLSEADLYLDAQSHRSVTVHANPLWTDADQQAPALAHQPEPHVEQLQLDLACQHSADGQAPLQVPHMTAQPRPVPEYSVPQQVPQLSLQQAELSENSYSSRKQHVSSCVGKQSRFNQMSGSPQSARSSQSDATHLDHLDGVSANPLAWSPEDEQSPRTIPDAVTSMAQKASQVDDSPDRALKNMTEPADARQAVQQHRQLTDITNTCKARRMAPAKAPRLRLYSQGNTAATVGDMVTFWEQRARAPLHTSWSH